MFVPGALVGAVIFVQPVGGVCADNASLEAYSAHPAHLECVAVIKPLIAARACVDYTD